MKNQFFMELGCFTNCCFAKDKVLFNMIFLGEAIFFDQGIWT